MRLISVCFIIILFFSHLLIFFYYQTKPNQTKTLNT